MRITHPFHPRFGQELEFLDRQQLWGDDRVYVRANGHTFMVPARWTSLIEADPVVQIGAGRSRLRADDLAQLASLLQQLRPTKRSRK